MAKPSKSDPRLAARTRKLNVVFALSSVGLLVAVVWCGPTTRAKWKQLPGRVQPARVDAHPGADRERARPRGRRSA